MADTGEASQLLLTTHGVTNTGKASHGVANTGDASQLLPQHMALETQAHVPSNSQTPTEVQAAYEARPSYMLFGGIVINIVANKNVYNP